VIFRKILQKTLDFNCDLLKEGKRYLTIPLDFPNAQTIFSHRVATISSYLIAFRRKIGPKQ
jgi:hypothetical protein